mmetsp:Transcript_36067/g.78963  ORF Transcript_36067/g.78963 Transcript_36067/m.78963 type:complete len:367 (-) Transcript_36067:72-1172(-)
MSFSDTQIKAMAITPKVSSALSLPGSAYIIYQSIVDFRRKKTGSAMQRALVGMSCVDFLSSIGWFLSTWAAPVSSGAYLASGNEATCRFQGFLLQVAIGAPMYNGALVLYYLLCVKYKWRDDHILKVEPYVHVFIWVWCLGTSAVLLGLNLMHFIGPVCWVSDPPECYEDMPDPSEKCGTAKYYATAFFCTPLWIVILTTIGALIAIYLEIRATSMKMKRYAMGSSELGRTNSDLKAVALRAVLYSLAFIVTWVASTVWSIAQFFDYYPFGVSYAWTLLEPLQGFWNALIFIHNRPATRERVSSVLRTLSLSKSLASRSMSTKQKSSELKSAEEKSVLRQNEKNGDNEVVDNEHPENYFIEEGGGK